MKRIVEKKVKIKTGDKDVKNKINFNYVNSSL